MGINVLSLFDGLSGGRLALERAGVDVDQYFSSEIDKYAIKIANKNYPMDAKNRLGDICSIDIDLLPGIDLLIGGSPCQNFSFAGKGNGMNTTTNVEVTNLDQYLKLKNDNFSFEGQSYLFWEYAYLLKELKPKYFLLENVKMAKKWEKVITEALGVDPIVINSHLVSAQNRPRLFWTNIPNVTIPKDKGILLSDVITEVDFDPLLDNPIDNNISPYIRKNIVREYKQIIKSDKMLYCCKCQSGWADNVIGIKKSPTIRASTGKQLIIRQPNGYIRKASINEMELFQTLPINYTKGVSNTQRGKLIGNGWTIDVVAHILKQIKGIKND